MSEVFVESFKIFLVYAFAFTLLARLGSRSGFLKPMVLLWILTIAVASITHPLPTAEAKALFYFFAFTFFGLYVLAVVVAKNSVTLRMMDEIERGAGLTRSQLRACFSDSESVDARIEMMQRGGILTRNKDGTIKLLPKGARIGKAALFVRRIFSVATPG